MGDLFAVGHQTCFRGAHLPCSPSLHRDNALIVAAPSFELFFYQQISVSQIKVDKVQIIGLQSSFAVCLDQDEQKILQSVTK